jgi:formate/nitrite transporter FocA (FNT family)
VGAPQPEEIYERTEAEGERRLSRPFLELASTAASAGIDVVFGLVALATVSHFLTPHFGTDAAHFFGSVAFGVAFVFIVVGRSELFTENFLVPLAAFDRRDRMKWRKLAELWTVSPLFNILGGALLIVILSSHGVLPHGSGTPLVSLADELDRRGFVAAFLSAIAAGALITLMTWMIEGMEQMGVRVAVAWIGGALLALGAFNHVVVVTLEALFGIRYGSTMGWGDFAGNFFTAAAGNMVGGIGLVTLTRFTQARSGARTASD